MNLPKSSRFSVLFGVLAVVFSAACGGGTTVGTDTSNPIDTLIPVDTRSEDVSQGDGVVPDLDVSVKDLLGDGIVPPTDEIDPPETSVTCSGPGEFMCECSSNTDCISGYCVKYGSGSVCTMQCITECIEGWDCVQDVQSLPDKVTICLPAFQYMCSPCEDDEDCHSIFDDNKNACIDFNGNGSFCGSDCTGDENACPSGYACEEIETEVGAVLHQCMPISGECSCSQWMIDLGASTGCYKENNEGRCEGTRVCAPSGLTQCSALEPKMETCNEIDDNCDGVIDPLNSEGCTPFYKDDDGDDYGIGSAECFCEQPGPNYSTLGGDCNDNNYNINPNKLEICNQVDDNCNGKTDEPYSEGCTTYYLDMDNDGYGDDNSPSSCLCSPEPGWTAESGDCNDEDPDMSPGVAEVCDGKDNNCNSVIDEMNAQGCMPYFLDQDHDEYGLGNQMKCLCAPLGDYTATKGGDCNDNVYEIHPTVVERCDGVDNNCNGSIDEGEAVNDCGTVAHGTVVCSDGCVITGCETGFFNIDGIYVNGCECQLEETEVADQTCGEATSLGQLGDWGTYTYASGKLVPVGDEDWFSFEAVDQDNGVEPDGCDKFHVRVRFITNPNDAFVFDVFRGSCAGIDNVCVAAVEFDDNLSFHSDSTEVGIGGGECPCMEDSNHQLTPPILGGVDTYGIPNDQDDTHPGAHECTNQTDMYYVKVYKKANAPATCSPYQLEFSNAINPEN